MNILVIVGIVVAFISIILIILINQYNKFQWIKIKIDKGETNITNALTKKYNILLRYLDILKNNKIDIDDNEYEEYKLLNLKISINRLNSKVDTLNNIINKYMDNNEKLLQNESIININKELMEANINTNGGKKYYNDNLEVYNHLCHAFPSNIVAKLFKYKDKDFLDNELKEELKILDE